MTQDEITEMLSAFYRDALEPTLVFLAYMDPSAEARLETFGANQERLVIVGDVETREMRIVSRWEIQEEVANDVIGRLWSER